MPSVKRNSLLIIETIPDLVDHLDYVLHQIYTYNENNIKEIYPRNFDKLEMKIKYKKIIPDDKYIRKFEIRSEYDNPFRTMNTGEIKVSNIKYLIIN